ncbi:WD repeat-containing protein 6 [Scaptodrosophila lebanonensis]|uniref:tRNA (34-2'-O)-methyltransferase regulator WDR6 n=1 Tax=Drosophila lebanonensis TaxID=7225 RepID=A0A6J2TUM9_DROLE|nr:WD repeat-containing protein 6 [Scaptodrosophila lebanonensis]
MRTNQALFTDALGLQVAPDSSILVGVGNQAFLRTSTAQIQLPLETRYRKVQGFALGSDRGPYRLILLYTDNEYFLFRYASDQQQKDPFKLLYEAETKDWINAASFLEDSDDEDTEQFVLHMAHSTLLRIKCQSQLKSELSVNIVELICCTDYSMLYHTHLHGGKFEELLVMSGNGFGELLIWQPSAGVSQKASIKRCPLLLRMEAHNGVIFSIAYHPKTNLLVTTSDDRSVKFWHLQKPDNSKTDCQKVQVRPILSCFGHEARVMCAIIVEYDGRMYIISGGEDSFICVWNRQGELVRKRRHQFGASIWRLAYDPNTTTLYSSGSTGNVLSYNLHQLLSQQQKELTELAALSNNCNYEFVSKVKFLNHHIIIALCNKSRLYYTEMSSSIATQSWHLVQAFPTYKCTVLATQDGLIACCGLGRVTLMRFDSTSHDFQQLYDGSPIKGVIRAFHFLSKELFLISDEEGTCMILKGPQLEVEARISLPSCREPWPTAALLLSPNCVLLSTRNGHVILYARDDASSFELKATLKRLHGNMGATMLEQISSNAAESYILSAGHESTIKYLVLRWSDYSLAACRRENVPLAWVEASPTQDLLLGFNDNHIIVWSKEHDVLAQLPCGGGHRYWDYQIHRDVLQIVFVKTKKVFHYRLSLQHKSPALQLRNRWHTRGCNTMQLLERHSTGQTFVVSAGDDNIIKVSSFVDGTLQLCTELHTHISSVRHLTLHQLVPDTWLIFSVGGRAQLCINKIKLEGHSDCHATELSTHTVRTDIAENKIMLEARLMAVDVLRRNTAEDFSVYIASADGKIRLHFWQLQQPDKLNFLYLIDLQRCPLQLRCLATTNLLLVTTTNGHIVCFDPELRTKRFEAQLHSAGVNALDAFVDGQLLHILSGGDDEDVVYTTIELHGMTVLKRSSFTGLHDAQVNALTIQPWRSPNDGELYAYTCGIDKQIYRLSLTTQQYTSIGYTCIADIKGMLLDAKQRVYFYGCGLQVLSLEPK